jgi:proteasome lid subunit RPN8/RPN11
MKRKTRKRRRRPRQEAAAGAPALRFTPWAWAKLLYLRDLGDTEVGGFGITPAGDLLLVEDVCLVEQLCTFVSVRFDDGAVADFFDAQVDQGRKPAQFARIWVHTHPGNSAQPSATDEETFARCFGSSDWALMFILARGGEVYARLRFSAGPGGEILVPVLIDYGQAFPASDHAAWKDEYARSVIPEERWWPVEEPLTRGTILDERDSSRQKEKFGADSLFEEFINV